jgi:S-DNA-T family DNA segregation ATPase FtsK/SpoIIIE
MDTCVNIMKMIEIVSGCADEEEPEVQQGNYTLPSITLLNSKKGEASECCLSPSIIEEKLSEFGFEGKVENICKGPLVTRYEIRLAPGVRISQVKKLTDDLAVALESSQIRIQAPIPGTSLVGIEVANKKFATIGFKDVVKAVKQSDAILPIGIGVTTTGVPKVVDLAKMPHLLIAGQTGSGKSVGLNSIILSLLYTKTPDQCKLVMIDPKKVEMSSYKDLPNLLCPVVSDAAGALNVLENLVKQMESRYQAFSSLDVRNIESYYKVIDDMDDLSDEEKTQHKNTIPYIVVIIDEMAFLMSYASKQTEACIGQLAQVGRAAGIHLVLATQKPLVKVITGLIKSNLPTRIAYQVTSGVDSRGILDCNGAEKLLGRGDLLMQYPGVNEPERFHGAWVSDKEVQAVCDSLRS